MSIIVGLETCDAIEETKNSLAGILDTEAFLYAFEVVTTLPLRPHVCARTREGTSSASKWTGTRVPRNAGFPPMILPINRSLVGASGRAD